MENRILFFLEKLNYIINTTDMEDLIYSVQDFNYNEKEELKLIIKDLKEN